MAEILTPGQTLPAEDFSAVLAAWHGGLKSTTQVPIPSGIQAGTSQWTEYTLHPIYRYYFNDGSYVEARQSSNGLDYEVEKYQVSAAAQKQQTAEAKPPESTGTRYGINPETGQTAKITVYEDGTTRYDDQAPSSQTAARSPSAISAPSNAQYIPIMGADGQVTFITNENYVPPEDKNAMTEYQSGQLEIQREAATRANEASQRAERTANRPTVINTNQKDPYITTMDVEGNLTSQENPSYDAALAQFEQVKERLATMFSWQKLDATMAKNAMDKWFTVNVDIPFKQSAEARARAAEVRAAQEAEDRRREFAANYERQRETTALTAGQEAVKAELDTLPYRAGPAFGEQMGSALTSLAQGSSAGVNFTADAFEFQAPNLQKIAQRATANALKSISPVAQSLSAGGQQPAYATADYGGINLQPSTPPPSGSGLDVQGILNSLYGGGGGGQATAPASDGGGSPELTDEELAALYG